MKSVSAKDDGFLGSEMVKTFLRSARAPVALTVAGALILIAVIAIGFVIASRNAALTNDVLEAREIRGAATDELEMLLDAETGQRGYLLTGRASYLTPYLAARRNTERALAHLERVSRGPTLIPVPAAEIWYLTNAKLDELQQTVSLRQRGDRDAALAVVLTNRGKNLMDRARADLSHVSDAADRILIDDLSELDFYTDVQRAITAAGGLLAIMFSGLSIWLLLRSIRDVTDARIALEGLNTTLEQRVLDRTTELTVANEEIQRFAYIVSHDLRAPLVNIMGFTSELEVGMAALQNYFVSEEREKKPAAVNAVNQDLPEAVKFIRASTGKMDRLINAILKLSREGRRELAIETVNLNALFENLAASVHHQIDETETTMAIEPLPSIRSDRVALEQVFGNLLDNALKYLAPGRPGKITIKAEGTRNTITISVIDNGRGIAEQDRERVFELFRRAGVQDKPGEGIGLAHTRALVRRLGGDIVLRSEFGAGSEFRVVLPRTLSPGSE
jgi:signal transduction histidine kinase